MTRTTYTTKKEIEQACLDKARRPFTQANKTPMLQQLALYFQNRQHGEPGLRTSLRGDIPMPSRL